jgi:3-isopropylmalate dehydrogenase
VHGSAPDLAGRDVANPIGAMTSAALLLERGLGRTEEAAGITRAIERVLISGARTADIAAPGAAVTGTRAFADLVVREIEGGRGLPGGEPAPSP